jgi:uncharacterized membrane protein YbaN (DUF454 family)
MSKSIYLCCGWLCVLLGAVGIFVPLLPTTPFLLLASYFFSRGSETVHHWLLDHRLFGELIGQWERHGVISLRAKSIATGSIVLLLAYPVVSPSLAPPARVALVVIGLGVLVFIWSRPSRPAAHEHPPSKDGQPPDHVATARHSRPA